MPRKKSNRPHGHYCKICGEYKANEKFSGKGHAAHICKVCSRLSAAEKAEAQTITRLTNFPMGRLSANDKVWLENRLHDHRPEVAELAREVYNIHFPYAERNARKKQLVINTLTFEIHTEVYDEFGDELSVNRKFTADRISRVLTMVNFDGDKAEQSISLDGKKMSNLLRWVVHGLEIFMWEDDYNLHPSWEDALPYFDLLPEEWPDENLEGAGDDIDEMLSDSGGPFESEDDASWWVQIEYTNHSTQKIVSWEDYLSDRPEELYLALLDYFEPSTDDFIEEYSENNFDPSETENIP